MRVDVHQHLWTAPLLDALAERSCLPFVRGLDGLTVLFCAGEQPYAIDLDAQSAASRSAQLREAGIERALLAISSPIGIEALPRAQADPLIDAHLDGVLALGPAFGAWGPLALDGIDPDDVDAALARGCAGVSLPAGAIAEIDALSRLERVLDRASDQGVPLFVHPGRGLGQRASEPSLEDPLWWPALTGYVAQMQAAWLAFAVAGRRRHPALTVVFALLAGGAPLLCERLAIRGGPRIDLRDPRTF